MFIGHIAVGLAAKRVAPATSLGTLLLSAQFIDLLWPVFLILGFEHVRIAPGNTAVSPLDFYDYPFTHSLLGTAAWSLGLGALYFGLRRYTRGAWIVGLAVLSHWVLDAISHRPDLLIVPGGHTRVGLGLWNSLAATMAVELGLFIVGLALYLRSSSPRDRVGLYGFWVLMAAFLVLYVSNLFGPPPPSPAALAWVALGAWLFVPVAFWIDGHRQALEL